MQKRNTFANIVSWFEARCGRKVVFEDFEKLILWNWKVIQNWKDGRQHGLFIVAMMKIALVDFILKTKQKLSVEFGGIEKYVTRENLIWRRREKVLWQIT